MNAARVIVLTGATRGLGRALVPHFVKAGHTVVGCGRSADRLAQLTHQFVSRHAPHCFERLDIRDAEAVAEWAQEVVNRIGPPDLLINNAAVMNALAPLWEVSSSIFDAVIDTNVKGVANAIRAFVPAMVARKSGIIVNLSSGWGRSTAPEVAPYCASKFAVEGMTRALAQELPAGMAAIPLNPGVIDTDMLRSAWGDEASGYPSADEWAKRAAPFILNLRATDNGKPLSVG